MPNYVPSNLAIGQANLTAAFQKGEMRFRDPVVWKSLVANTPLSIPEASVLRTREDRAYEVNFFARSSRALGSARSHNHTGTKSDTQVITPSYSTYSDPFYTSIKQADNNVRSLQEMFNHELMNSAINFTEGLETASSNFLFSNRSQVNGVTTEGTFNGTNFAFEITDSTNGNRAIQITKMVMDLLKYQMPLDIYCDSVSFNKFQYLQAQGPANGTNTAFQFTDGSNTFYHSAELDASAAGLSYTAGFWLAVPKGMAVAIDWIPRQNRNGVDFGNIAQYSTIINPIDGQTYALHKYNEGADETANNGYTQDVKEEFELSIDVAFESAPLTVANEEVIQAFALV